MTIAFTPHTPGPPIAGLASVEEGRFVEGRWVRGRTLAGDDAGQSNPYLAASRRRSADPPRHALPAPLIRWPLPGNCSQRAVENAPALSWDF